MKAPLSMMPLLPVAAAMVAGIVAEEIFDARYGVVIALVFAACMVAAVLLRRRAMAILLAAATVGSTAAAIGDRRLDAAELAGRNLTLTADVVAAKESGTSQLLTVRILRATDSLGRVRNLGGLKASIAFTSFNPRITPAQRLRFIARLAQPQSRLAHPEEFDIAATLRRNNIRLQAMVVPEQLLEISDAKGVMAAAARAKNTLTEIIGRSAMKSSTKEFLTTTLLGDASAIPADLRDDFSRAGLAHLLALSGLHVGIIASLLALLLLPLRFALGRGAVAPITIACLWAFAFVTGLSPSVTRSVIMATVLISAVALQRRHSATNSLSLAAILILLFDPFAIKSISFQLSFLAVAGIIVFAGAINPVNRQNRKTYAVVGAVTVTVAAMLATGVVSLHYFHRFPLLFIVANLISAPLLPLLLSCGVLTIAANAAGFAVPLLCKLTDLLTDALILVSSTTASLPFASIDNIYLSTATILFASLTIIAAAVALHTRRRLAVATLVTFALCTITVHFIPANADRDMTPIVLASPLRTDVMIPSAGTLRILTTEHAVGHAAVVDDVTRLFADYMNRRSITDVEIHRAITRTIINFGGKNLLIAASCDSICDIGGRRIDYLLLTGAWHGDIERLLSHIEKGTAILLSADMHHRVRKRVAEKAAAAGFTIHDLSAVNFQPFASSAL